MKFLFPMEEHIQFFMFGIYMTDLMIFHITGILCNFLRICVKNTYVQKSRAY